jgi:hypothetical protein
MRAKLSPRTRARIAVGVTGVVCAIVLGLTFAEVGGPDTGRRDRRDTARLTDMREIAQALICHGAGDATTSRPVELAAISPACLSPDAAARLRDPATGAPYTITWVNARTARVCGELEDRARAFTAGWPPFDAATGCVTAALR